ncbi:DNA repair protein RadC [Sporocytophaga myxococcoides]|uniref:DNA repair protein RadC n=2 Tax=Sporocytophaga myxococcoides TaxID=153721 RepID=A0A098LC43_9BACT|nr:DNA repair protein RadC [Sporocytophaga myxococcoides]
MQEILLREKKIDRNKEHFWTIGLANNNQILYIELISLGGTSKTIVEPMQVFRVGVLKGAVKMLLVHNHPSGDLIPSEQDKDITDRLLQVGIILDIQVIDYLIISEKSFTSFLDIGLLDILKKSNKYVPAFELEARIRKEAEALGEERGKYIRNVEIAKELKKKGLGDQVIAEVTGLSIGEVEELD